MTLLQPGEAADFRALFDALAMAFETEGRPGGDEAVAALRAADTAAYRRAASASHPGALLEEACALVGALPEAGLVLACRRLIDWTCWQGEGLDAGVSARLHAAELVGPDGHIPAKNVRIGLLVSEPDTNYPVSSHSGEETYFVISGTAEWTVGDEPYRARAPGTLIHHPAWVPHGRRTLTEPFLGAWRWSGDLDLASFRVER
ncbi:dimethylsulfonioproprionate lyase family protein [Hoeflea sp. TYP-13]|uniref:dimethylsulfonioproprionate lyase family protein n=1 Tax=Hoeflea sp. TYP-13 TaxID=3230023 RepID=UPI0034C5D2C6